MECQPQGLAKCCRKLHENEEILTGTDYLTDFEIRTRNRGCCESSYSVLPQNSA